MIFPGGLRGLPEGDGGVLEVTWEIHCTVEVPRGIPFFSVKIFLETLNVNQIFDIKPLVK